MSAAQTSPGDDRRLRISFRRRAGEGAHEYDVAVEAASGEREERPFAPRLTQAQVDAALASTGDANKPAVRRSALVETVDPAQDLGGRLFEAVFGGRMGRLYQQEAAAASDDGARMVLRFATDEPDIAALPWELLYDFAVRNDFVVLCRGWSLSREQLARPDGAPSQKPARSIRALVIASSLPGGPGVEQECKLLSELAAGTRRIGLTVLRDPTLEQLEETLAKERFHVFHFIGTAVETGFDQSIVLPGPDGDPMYLGADRLFPLLARQTRLQLVFLNGCNTDLLAREATRVVPTAIGMQGMVLDEACVTFARAVYGAIVEGAPLGLAVAHARKAIDHETPGSRQWAMPVLYAPPADAPLLGAVATESAKAVPRPIAPAGGPGQSEDERRAAIQLHIAERNLEALRARGADSAAAPAFLTTQLQRALAEVTALKQQIGDGRDPATR